MVGLKAGASKPTNMAKVYHIRQQTDQSPVAYLECLKTFQQYTLYDLQTKEYTLIHQVAPDIRKKITVFRKARRKKYRRLVAGAEKVYNMREMEEQKKERREKLKKRTSEIKSRKGVWPRS